MKILILGASGMLGSSIYNVLKDKYELILSFRNIKEAELLDNLYGGVSNHEIKELDLENTYNDYSKGYGDTNLRKLANSIDVDYVINAIGVTIPFSLKSPGLTFFINSAFPFMLSNLFGPRLIHITTDCVFDGQKDYPYNENSEKRPVDIYSLSKSIGEPIDCLTLRTSIIGRELKGFNSLLEWFLGQEGKTVKGFTKHFWNGVTTKEFGNICHKIMQNRKEFPRSGIYHIFSETISKHDMLVKFKEKYKLDINIVKDDTTAKNRSLSTIYPYCEKLKIPSFDQMLKDL